MMKEFLQWFMKQVLFFSLFLFSCLNSFAQGNNAPGLKKMIGKTFVDEKKIPGLKGYQFRQGDVISDINDPRQLFLDVYLKGMSGIVVFSQREDTTVSTILDVIEIKSIPAGWEIKTAGCQFGQTEGEVIIALVNPGKKEYTTVVKQAWRCNRDKIRFEAISTKGIKCLNEGQD